MKPHFDLDKIKFATDPLTYERAVDLYESGKVTEFEGDIGFNKSKPDGTPVKCLNVSRLNELGWHAQIKIEQGIRETYKWYLKNQ